MSEAIGSVRKISDMLAAGKSVAELAAEASAISAFERVKLHEDAEDMHLVRFEGPCEGLTVGDLERAFGSFEETVRTHPLAPHPLLCVLRYPKTFPFDVRLVACVQTVESDAEVKVLTASRDLKHGPAKYSPGFLAFREGLDRVLESGSGEVDWTQVDNLVPEERAEVEATVCARMNAFQHRVLIDGIRRLHPAQGAEALERGITASADASFICAAAAALMELYGGDENVSRIGRLLTSEAADERARACTELRRYETKEAAAALYGSLEDEAAEVRVAALDSVVAMLGLDTSAATLAEIRIKLAAQDPDARAEAISKFWQWAGVA